MKFVLILFLIACTSNSSLVVQKELLEATRYASKFVGSLPYRDEENGSSFRYIVHYNLTSKNVQTPLCLYFIALTKDLKEVKFSREITKVSGYECFEFFRDRDQIFSYKIEIKTNSGELIEEHFHRHWVDLIKLDEVH